MTSRIHDMPSRWLALLLLIAVGLTGCDLLQLNKEEEVPEVGPRMIYSLGRLEPKTGIISISAIPGERLKELDPDVRENQLAPQNGVLGLLASFDMRRAQRMALNTKLTLAEEKSAMELEMAEAQQKQAAASLAQALAKAKELELQREKLTVLKRASEIAALEHNDLKQLSERDPAMVTKRQLDKKKNQMDMAFQDYRIAAEGHEAASEAANKAVTAAQANLDVATHNVRRLRPADDENRSPGEPQSLNEMAAVLEEINIADEALAQSVLWAPGANYDRDKITDIKCEAGDPAGDYTVLKVYLRPGEFVTQMPLMQLGDLSEMVCIAEVYEADVNDVCLGQEVTIRSPAFNGQFADGDVDPNTGRRAGGMKGKVERIGSIIASPGLASRNPLAPADRSVVEVRISINDAEAIKHARSRVGLQVTVEFGDKPMGTEDHDSAENGE